MDINEGSTIDAMIEDVGTLVRDSLSLKELDINFETYFEKLQNDETEIEWDSNEDSDKDADNDPDEDSDEDADDDPDDDSIDENVLTNSFTFLLYCRYDASRTEETGRCYPGLPTTSESSTSQSSTPTALDIDPPALRPLPRDTQELLYLSGSTSLTTLGLRSCRLSEISGGETFRERTRGRRRLMRSIGPRCGIIRISLRIKPSPNRIRGIELRDGEDGEPGSTWVVRRKAEEDAEALGIAMLDDLQLIAIVASGTSRGCLYRADSKAAHRIADRSQAIAALVPVEDVVSIISAAFDEHMRQLFEHNNLAYIPFPQMMPLVRAAMSANPSTSSLTTAAERGPPRFSISFLNNKKKVLSDDIPTDPPQNNFLIFFIFEYRPKTHQ
ncbi:hypothetical protein M9H77_08619 [Catharanthus roseus]|uniref:Uncharacterized protein n=1 Tax=Catharanthus roseus TaxID=4058 RepID=A0ACC0BYL0_CATRO|nr:hypothetical protein M9H77_08619 [Catharanthus roseus]